MATKSKRLIKSFNAVAKKVTGKAQAASESSVKAVKNFHEEKRGEGKGQS